MAGAEVPEVKDYKFFRSFSAKVESGWPMRKAEQFWRRLREKRIAGVFLHIFSIDLLYVNLCFPMVK